MVTRGEVWWYEHPEAGPRPFLLLSRTEAMAVLHQVIAVPATRAALRTELITRLGRARMEAVCRALRLATLC